MRSASSFSVVDFPMPGSPNSTAPTPDKRGESTARVRAYRKRRRENVMRVAIDVFPADISYVVAEGHLKGSSREDQKAVGRAVERPGNALRATPVGGTGVTERTGWGYILGKKADGEHRYQGGRIDRAHAGLPEVRVPVDVFPVDVSFLVAEGYLRASARQDREAIARAVERFLASSSIG
jgi:hypothetical protein